MEDDQAYSQPWHSQNSLFKHFQGYLGIFKDIDVHSATLRGAQIREMWRGLPFSVLKIRKSALILEEKR